MHINVGNGAPERKAPTTVFQDDYPALLPSTFFKLFYKNDYCNIKESSYF